MPNLPRVNFNPTSHKRYVLDSGAILKNFSYNPEADEFEFDSFGATSGGVNVEVDMSWRQVEVDGANHVQVKEHSLLEEFNAQATANVKEMSPTLFRDAFNAISEDAGDEMPEGFTKLTPRRTASESRFNENVAVVGTLSDGQHTPIIIILHGGAVQEGFSGNMEDNSEMTVEQTYVAHASLEELAQDPDFLPITVYIPNSLGEWEDVTEREVAA